MRITAIEIENFKGIADRVRVELKPITLLFGANSAGKSTILHALLYLRDVLERRNLDAITTPASGAALDLGGFRRFVHRQELERPIKIRVDMEVTGEELPVMAPGREFVGAFSKISGGIQDLFDQSRTQILQSVLSASVEIEVRWDELVQSPIAFAYTVGLNGADFCRYERDIDTFKVAKLDLVNSSVDWPFTKEDFGTVLAYVQNPDSFQGAGDDQAQLVRNLYMWLRFIGTPGQTGLTTWLPNPKDPIPDFAYHEVLHLPAVDWEGLNCWDKLDSDRDCMEIANSWAWDGTAFLARLIIGPGRLVRDWLRDLRYIGPLRARPPREGIPSVELGDWAEGLAAWKTLEQASPELLTEVGNWLSSKDHLNSGYGLTRQRRVELDADALDQVLAGRPTKTQLRALLRNASERTQINLLETRSGLELAPSEVGVGLSQVLPVVIAALDSPNGLVSIEQPELHIHPAMQVALGDLFIEGALNRGTQFLIETHSEHLILRLMRRIRENHISPEAVSVMFVMPKAQGIKFKELHIDEDGDFIDDWPGGFFEESFHEKFAGR